jgi:hypothetical protein
MTDPQARLEQVRRVLESLRELCAHRYELETVAQARSAYESLFARELALLDTLRQRKEALQAQRSRRPSLGGSEVSATAALLELLAASAGPRSATRPPSPASGPPAAPPSQDQRLRGRLEVLINRHRFIWRLEPAVVGQVNQIASDSDRPIGEALALLPWEAFGLLAGETAEGHLSRLAEWDEALAEFRARLLEEVEGLRVRFHSWLGIWQLWRERERDDEGRERWAVFVVRKRQTLTDDAERLRREVAELEGQP